MKRRQAIDAEFRAWLRTELEAGRISRDAATAARALWDQFMEELALRPGYPGDGGAGDR